MATKTTQNRTQFEVDISDIPIEVLNEVVATKIACYLRYRQNAIAATGIDRAQVPAEVTDDPDLNRMLTENLVAERIVITSYQEIIRCRPLGN